MDRVHPDDLRQIQTSVAQQLRDGQLAFQGEYRVRHRSGEWIWVREHSRTIVDGDGKPIRVVGSTWSIDRERRAAEALRASELRLRRIFEAEMIGILFWTIDGGIIDANDAFLSIVGYSRGDLEAGRLRWTEITPPEYARLDQQALAEIAERGVCAPFEKQYVRGDGSRVPVLIGAASLEPGAQRAVAFVLDITVRKNLEMQQQQFISNVSHELRSPLAAIQGFAQLMHRRGVYHERGVQAILEQTGQMERLIDDLLEVSRLQSGALQLRPERTDLVETVRRCAEAAQATTDHHTIDVEAPDVPVVGQWDPQRLSQIFRNLLSNAIKYSPDGGSILVRIELNRDQAEITIRDPGIGMDEAVRSRLFSRFFRAETSAHAIPGIGLGLYITRELVHAHGGSMMVSSPGPGQGSTFGVILPLQPPSAEQPDT
jgi:PAS domain S-box-containing protein